MTKPEIKIGDPVSWPEFLGDSSGLVIDRKDHILLILLPDGRTTVIPAVIATKL